MIKRNNKKKKGFTLIELIIVIAIIAILAAIAIPNFLSIQRKSRVKADIASAKTVYDATSALIAEDAIKSDGFFVVKKDAANPVDDYLQLIPQSESVKDDVFAVKVLLSDKAGTADTTDKDKDGDKAELVGGEKAAVTVYLVPKASTDNATGDTPNGAILVYPNGDTPYNLD
ncbi:prepilin-type N-terminal cleavage/methylation domain-containing protein [Clostridium sp. B9]|uniref:prepilin-type N-terminal cleavage/methylation domain-containing protein n=1 Tax=Clostridium sp. B9 TaxID=3423224 RepID=UPI003D2EC88E